MTESHLHPHIQNTSSDPVATHFQVEVVEANRKVDEAEAWAKALRGGDDEMRCSDPLVFVKPRPRRKLGDGRNGRNGRDGVGARGRGHRMWFVK